MRSISVSSLYFLSLVATQLAATALPSQPPLTFQVESNDNLPASADFESWPGDPSDSLQVDALNSQAHVGALSSPADENHLMISNGIPPVPRQIYNGLFPTPAPIPFLNFFQNFISRFAFVPYPILPPYHHHHHISEPIDCSQYTIGEVLNWTLHHTPKPSSHGHPHPPPLHRLAWLVNLSHPVQELLYDPKADLTLFAPNDEALTPPSKRKHHSKKGPLVGAATETSVGTASNDESTHIFWDALEAIETYNDCPHHLPLGNIWTKLGGEDKEKKKKFFLHAIEMVLKYHVSPGKKNVHEILDSSTLPTELPILPFPGSAKFRVRVGPSLPHLAKPGEISLNFFTKLDLVKYSPILTKNGVIYIATKAALLPPLSPLSELFLFPKPFSTLTSALQKVHLDDALLPRWANKTIPLSRSSESLNVDDQFGDAANLVDEKVHNILSSLVDDPHGKLVKPTFTVFAPTNHAFRSLGPAANAFLFSPFGAHVLRYVLSYHIVPHLIWNTDHCDEIKDGKPMGCDLPSQVINTAEFPVTQSFGPPGRFSSAKIKDPFPVHPGKVNITELSLGTLLGSSKNESLAISLVEFRHLGKGPTIRRVYIKPNSQSLLHSPDKHAIPVLVADGVAWGGAIHLIPQLVRPPVPAGHHHRKDVQRALELSILS